MTDEDERRVGVKLMWLCLSSFCMLFIVGTLYMANDDVPWIVFGFGLYGLSLVCLVTASFLANILWEGE